MTACLMYIVWASRAYILKTAFESRGLSRIANKSRASRVLEPLETNNTTCEWMHERWEEKVSVIEFEGKWSYGQGRSDLPGSIARLVGHHRRIVRSLAPSLWGLPPLPPPSTRFLVSTLPSFITRHS